MHEYKEPNKGNDLNTADGLVLNFKGIYILDKVLLCDEAWFRLNGFISSQNKITWSYKNSQTFHEAPLHSLEVGE